MHTFNFVRQALYSLLIICGFTCNLQASEATADHSKFPQLQKEFQTGPEVTAACLECHTEAAKQIHHSLHWTWIKKVDGEVIGGKSKVLNNFCVGISSNEPRCTSCHVGYGYKDQSFDFESEEAVDCLVCHDTTKKYKKFPTGAGHPNYKPKEWPKKSGKIRPVADLAAIAQHVGLPERDNCGSCHFSGGGGDAVKHGDMDSSLSNPAFELDVHMSKEGANLSCQDCHTSDSHTIDGSRYTPTATDKHGLDFPGHMDDGRASCASCHGNKPHGPANKRLDKHAEILACQSCHIPEFAREKATKTWWDWSIAGQKDENGKQIKRKDAKGRVDYMSKKGGFIWEDNVVPEYAWFNGEIEYTLVGEKVEPDSDGAIALTTIGGKAGDDNARIWPFKIMRGKQPYDSENQLMITPHLFGKDKNAYWKSFDWVKASKAGQESLGLPFSGKVDFIETTYHWPITHMVAPKEQTVKCEGCHSDNGRLDKIEDIYLPGRDHNTIIDTLGWSLVWLTIFSVIAHIIGRIVTGRRQSKKGA